MPYRATLPVRSKRGAVQLDKKKIAELVRDIRSELTSLKGSNIMDDEYEGTDEGYEGYIRDAIRSAIQKTQEILHVLGEYV